MLCIGVELSCLLHFRCVVLSVPAVLWRAVHCSGLTYIGWCPVLCATFSDIVDVAKSCVDVSRFMCCCAVHLSDLC